MKKSERKKLRFPNKRSMVLYFLSGSGKYFAASLISACLVTLLDMVNPKIIGFTVDSVIGDEPASLPTFLEQLWEKAGMHGPHVLILVAGLVVVLALLRSLFRYVFRLMNSKGSERFVKRIRDQVFAHLLNLPVSWYSDHQTGDIIQRCTSDVETIKMFLQEQLTSLFRIVLMIVMSLCFMAGISGRLTLYAGLFIPVIIGYSIFFYYKIGASFEKADIEEGKLSAIAQENLTGVRVVRAFGREQYEKTRFGNQNDQYTKFWIRLMKYLSVFWSCGDLFSYLQILTVLSAGAVFCVHGEMTAGSYIAFLSYNAMLTWPVRMLGRIIADLSKTGVSIDRIREIMNAEEEQDKPDALTPDLLQDIVFDHVSYQYENGAGEILDDVSFTVKAGSTVGILGGTGSGKSTLMYLLDRMYPLSKGKITIGGVDIADMKASWVRTQIGMVLQEPYLFSRTLFENIRIAKPTANLKEVRQASEIADLDDTVEHFTDKYETFVGERGVTLSGGQKQRTAIAQMLIRKPPIMIFDDSLSAVDAETDAKIRTAIHESSGTSTVILIAHRITTLMQADQIIVLDQGRVAEQGTHEQLLEKNGIYRKIYDLQMQGQEG